MKNKYEELLAYQLRALKIPYEREVKFCPARRWRMDFIVGNLAVEIDGGLWMKKGGHNTAKGIMRDMEKANAAQEMGFVVLRFSTKQVKDGYAINFIENFLKKNGGGI